MTTSFRALEFFAGIGLARLGMEKAGVDTIWANDIEPKKAQLHEAHHGPDPRYFLGDLAEVNGKHLPEAEIAWSSSPCTDLSLAGARKGIHGKESRAFWEWIRVLEEMGVRRPPVVVLENVLGLVSSNGGDDISAAIRALNDLGYSVDMLSIDAKHFIPQSRPRLFAVGISEPNAFEDMGGTHQTEDDRILRPAIFDQVYADATLRVHRADLPSLPPPTPGLSLLVDEDDQVSWWDAERQGKFMRSLSSVQKERLDELSESDQPIYRTAYRRTRNGKPVWEIRADDVAGCLRTARGGSSKQAVVRIHQGNVTVRWMTGREYAKLMGAPEFNTGTLSENQIMFGFGDAVAVPAVEWLTRNYLVPAVLKTEAAVEFVK